MATGVFSARLPQRELVMVAWKAGMLDCTTAEVTKYAVLRFIGHSHEEARELALSLRNTVDTVLDTEKTTTVQMPTEWIQAAQKKMPDASKSTLYRFMLTRLTMAENEALAESTKKMGRPLKNREAIDA